MTDAAQGIEEVIRHATMAHFDNECTSIVILMIANGEPECHLAIGPKDVFAINAAVDMFKVEMLKLMQEAIINKEQRK